MIIRNSFIGMITLASLLPAQSDRGRISGTAYDPSGAVVPRASLQIVNPQTDAIRRTATDDKGFYLVEGLPPASYSVVISSPGLAELTVADVRLGAGEGRLLDLHLQPASVKEAVSVVAESDSQVQTHTASIAATVGEEPVQNLPI